MAGSPFSAIAACPLTAWLLKKYRGIAVSGWTRFAVAFLIIVLGRLVLKIEGRGNFLPGPLRWKTDAHPTRESRPDGEEDRGGDFPTAAS
jgi:hypothetical protein